MSLLKRNRVMLPSSVNDYLNTARLFPSMFDYDQDLLDINGDAIMAPSANIYENETNFEIEIAVPGMEREDFKIQMDKLTIEYLPVTAKAIDAAFKVAELFAQSLEKLADVTKFILGDMTGAELARSLGLSESETPPAPSGPARPGPLGPLTVPPGFPGGTPPTAPATPATPAEPAAPPNPPGLVSQSRTEPDAAEQRTAALQLEIDRLNREVVAIRNTPPPVNGEQTVILTAIRTVLEDSSNKLTGIKDALA